jgi:small subunit ribosomal protein S14
MMQSIKMMVPKSICKLKKKLLKLLSLYPHIEGEKADSNLEKEEFCWKESWESMEPLVFILQKKVKIKNKVILNRFSSITSDQKRRFAFCRDELKGRMIKSVLKKEGLRRLSLVKPIYKAINRKIGSISRVKNRCVLTGHPVGISKLGVSRIMLRNLGGFGKIPGLVKI